ncbi:Aminopeptidase 2 mitochondrial [Marasmius sp. AFHP31]|nr:Aminopeptidase 2 mitochondrial [Marasmius sp. AFHP31]
MTSSNSAQDSRLPTNVKPTHYDLTIRTDLQKLVFEGLVKVRLEVNERTDTIVLNSSGLKLGKASVISGDSRVTEIEHVVYEKEKRVAFKFPEEFNPGCQVLLEISFSGDILDNQVGYYRSSWMDDGKTKYIALSQFAPIDARRGFPCWDEPQLKATYAVALISRIGTTNLSNMPAMDEKAFSAQEHAEFNNFFNNLDSEWKVTTFETTPLMSSYIVAYANGEFSHLQASVTMPLSGRTVPVRMYTTPDLIHQAQFALELKSRVLPLCEKVFDVEYPLPKLDTLVVTNFGGAMENWGLITGRTRSFLLDPNSTDMWAKKMVIKVHSHEISHMWFGNITTMEWWDYLYLNEGFATLMGEVIIPDILFPELKSNTEFINRHLAPAMSLDSKLSSHPIEVSCPDVDLIQQVRAHSPHGRNICASVLRMLAAHVGTEQFLEGVSIYLKNHLYGSTTTSDLWEGISNATGELMGNWVTKTGFPLLTVTETDGGIKVRQDRLLETGLAEDKDNETIWNIPLAILSVQEDGSTSIDRSLVLEEREKTYPLDTSRPYKLNAGTSGVYRVLYTEERLKKIASEISKPKSPFGAEDRLGLITDSLALSKAALTRLSDALTLIDALKHETEYLAWSSMAIALDETVSIWWEHTEIRGQLNEFRRSLFAPLVEGLGYENSDSDSPDVTQLRTCAIEQCVSAGQTNVVEELKSRFKQYMDHGDDSRIPPDLQKAIFIAAVKYGGRPEYDAMKMILESPKTSSARVASIYALSGARNETLIREGLQFLLSGAKKADIAHFFLGYSTNGYARKPMVEFFHNNYDELYEQFIDTYYFKFMIEFSFSSLTSKEDLARNIEFFERKDTSRYSLVLAQTHDNIRARIAYIEHSTGDLAQWLDGRK